GSPFFVGGPGPSTSSLLVGGMGPAGREGAAPSRLFGDPLSKPPPNPVMQIRIAVRRKFIFERCSDCVILSLFRSRRAEAVIEMRDVAQPFRPHCRRPGGVLPAVHQ